MGSNTLSFALLFFTRSTEQQFIHAERKAFAICEKEGPSLEALQLIKQQRDKASLDHNFATQNASGLKP
jgi:hypothetical protein